MKCSRTATGCNLRLSSEAKIGFIWVCKCANYEWIVSIISNNVVHTVEIGASFNLLTLFYSPLHHEFVVKHWKWKITPIS